MALAITVVGEVIILSTEYPHDAVSWAKVYDNFALGWLVDGTAVASAALGDLKSGRKVAGRAVKRQQYTGIFIV
jgi:hypothetical protein